VPRDPRVFLDDIIEACAKIHRYTQGMTSDQFRSDEKTVDAVVRNLEVIGEAARSLPSDIRDRIVDIEWQRIAALRNLLIHEYFGVDLDIIWDVVQTKVPTLRSRIQAFLN
jgi:uncharacterized protein with HEPN domain